MIKDYGLKIIFQELKLKQILLEILEENLMTVSSHTSTPLNTTLTFSGNVDQLLAPAVDRPQDFYQTTSWVLPSLTRLDGAYPIGDF